MFSFTWSLNAATKSSSSASRLASEALPSSMGWESWWGSSVSSLSSAGFGAASSGTAVNWFLVLLPMGVSFLVALTTGGATVFGLPLCCGFAVVLPMVFSF
jgi:hypothetical protein